jgi:hypothetical protein
MEGVTLVHSGFVSVIIVPCIALTMAACGGSDRGSLTIERTVANTTTPVDATTFANTTPVIATFIADTSPVNGTALQMRPRSLLGPHQISPMSLIRPILTAILSLQRPKVIIGFTKKPYPLEVRLPREF